MAITIAVVLLLGVGCSAGGSPKKNPRPENASIRLSLEQGFESTADTWLYTGFVAEGNSLCSEAQSFGSRFDIGAAHLIVSFLDRSAGTASVNRPSEAFLRSEELGDRPYLQGTLTIVEWTNARIELNISDTQLCADTGIDDGPMLDCVPGPDGTYVADAWSTFDDVGEFNRNNGAKWEDLLTGEPLCTGSHLIGADELAERTQDTGGDL
jgi:hypothetical protein